MNCDDFRQLLMNQVELDSAGREHAADCPACRQYEQTFQHVLGTAKAKTVSPNLDLNARIVSALKNERRRSTQVMSRRLVGWAMAASLLFVLAIGFQGWFERKPSGMGAIAKLPRKVAPRAAPTGPVEALASLSGKLVDESRQNFGVVFSAATPVDAQTLQKLTPAESPSPLVAMELKDNLRSVGNSARRAFVFFSTEFPMFDLAGRDGAE